MSKQIDERVVSMQFDNRNFERNVQTTLGSIDKLNKSLEFKDSAKGLENISRAASKVDMSPLSRSVEEVRAKFSALDVVAVTALANITNSAVNAGKHLVKSLSVDQVTAGWGKYEQKTASVQTIMNATGKSIDEVNNYLAKLMWFSDETSYGFNDMTTALGQMTSSGGDIEKLIPLITGVANATAYAGKGASEFSRVMYNLNQSYGAGYLQFMDWKSLELAGVGSKQLKQVFIDTAVEMGKIKEGQVTIANFGTTLKDKWADTEVMERAFGKFGEFSDAVHKLGEDIESGDLSAYPEEIRKMAEEGLLENTSDKIEALSKYYGELGTTAFKSAQEAKTFTEAIDATKDAVSSQWMKTFELIFGTYVDQKKLWTDLANGLWEVFAGSGDSRNAWLENVLTNNAVTKLSEKLQNVTKAVEAPIKKLEEYNDLVNKIIRGDFGNGQARYDKLTQAGYDWAHAQNLVNEKLGSSVRHATNFNDAQTELVETTAELTDAKLEDIGLTEEEIVLYRELEAESKKTGKSIGELIEEMKNADARTLLLNSFRNIGNGLLGVIRSIKEAFSEIFPAPSVFRVYKIIKAFNELTSKLRLINSEEDDLNETGQKLKRTFKGLFAALDIVLTLVGGPVKMLFKALANTFKNLNIPILDVTAGVGDAIVAFRDWLDSVLDFDAAFEYLSKLLTPAINKVKEWAAAIMKIEIVQKTLQRVKDFFAGGLNLDKIQNGFNSLYKSLGPVITAVKECAIAFWNLKPVQSIVQTVTGLFSSLFGTISSSVQSFNFNTVIKGITDFFNSIKDFFTTLGKSGDSGKDLISGLGGALSDGVKVVVNAIQRICEAIYNTFTTFFDINSPSKVMMTLGKFIIAGLVAGLLFNKDDTKNAMGEVGTSLVEGLQTAVDTIVGIIKSIDLSTILSVGFAIGMFTTINKVIKVMEMFGTAAKGFGSMCTSAGKLMDAFTQKINPTKTKFEKTTDCWLKLAGAVLMLAGAVYMLAQLDYGKLWSAVGAVTVLAAVMVGLSLAVGKFGGVGGDVDFKKATLAILGMSAALFIIAEAIQKLEFIDKSNMGPILWTLTTIVIGLSTLMIAFGGMMKLTSGAEMGKVALVILSISVSCLLLAHVIKSISKLELDALKTGITCITAFGLFIASLILMTNFAGPSLNGLGTTIMKLALAMLTLVTLIKIVSKLDPKAFAKGLICVTLLGTVVAGLIAATRLAGGKDLKGVGSTLIAMGASIALLALVVKMMSKMEPAAFTKGIICVALLGGVVVGLVAATKLAGGNSLKGVSITLLSMSISIAMIAGVAALLGFIDLKNLAKGTIVVSILGGIVALMIAATANAKDCKANIIAMTTAIGIMAAAVFVLSLIDPKKLAGATTALTIVMGMFALMIYVAGLAKASMGSLIVMTVAVGLMAGIIWALTELTDVQKAVSAAQALAMVMGAASVALLAASFVGKLPLGEIGKGLLALAGVLTVMIGLAFIINKMPAIEDKSGSLVVLTVLMAAMSVLLLALTGIGALIGATGGMALAGILGLTLMIVPLVAFAFAISKLPDVSSASDSITVVIAVMASMAVLSAALAGVSLLIPGAIAGVLGMAMLIAELTIVLAAIGALAQIPGLEWLISEGGNFLQTVGTAIGQFLGGIAAGFAKGATSALPQVGADLSAFMVNATPFIVGVKMIDSAMLEGVKSLAEIILILTGAGIIDALTSWLTGGSSLVDFGKQLAEFGPYISEFAKSVANINSEAVTAAANAGKMLAEMADTIPSDWGNNNLTDFGDQFAEFGDDIVAFSESVSGKVDINGINTAADGSKKMIEIAKAIPSDWGGNNVTNFGTQLVSFGGSLASFSSSVNGKTDAIASASASIKELVVALSDVTSVGATSISTFSTALITIGQGGVDGFISAFTGSNEKVKTAINTFVDTASGAIKTQDNYNKFKSSGSYLVDGFVAGITENTYKATAQAKAMAKAAYTAANEELQVNSPSKKFKMVGSSVVEGFALGITSNFKDVKKSGIMLGDTMLKATQDNLDINSPSLVFDKEVGRWIVKGVAEGIKKDMSAEEAAEKKAQNIVNAFKKELEKYSLDSDIASKEFDLWKLTDGKGASDEEINAKELGMRNRQKYDADQQAVLAYDEWQETIKVLGENSKEAKEAKSKYLDAKIEQGKIDDEIAAIDKRRHDQTVENLENEIDDQELAMSIRSQLQDNWKKSEGLYADEKDIHARELKDLKADEKNLAEIKKLRDKQHDEDIAYHAQIKAKYESGQATAEDVKAAKEAEEASYQAVLEIDGRTADNAIAIKDKEAEWHQILLDDSDAKRNSRNLNYEKWLAMHPDASEAEKEAAYRTLLSENLVDLEKDVKANMQEYYRLREEYGEDHALTREAHDRWIQSVTDKYNTKNSIAESEKESLERERDDLQEQMDLASENAELRYQLWESTTGKKASSYEKSAMKVSMLNEQLAYERNVLTVQQERWQAAVKEYGKKSNEALAEQNEYLNQSLKIANLQNDIADIQKSTIEKQDLAKKDYRDYMEKYKKYYLENGKTLEDLEKDARLISGYDPDLKIEPVDSTLKNINGDLDSLDNNSEYASVLDGYKEIGTSMIDSTNAGITETSSTLTDTLTTLMDSCLLKIDSYKEDWKAAAITLMESFIAGIDEKLPTLISKISSVSSISSDGYSAVLAGSTIGGSLAPSTSTDIASGISHSMASKNQSETSTSSKQESVTQTYTFTQNNYSPKALSDSARYRNNKTFVAASKKIISGGTDQ